MTPAFTARRRAEEFDALVEALSPGSLHDAQDSRDTRYADLLEVVGALRAAPPPTPRPDFVADLRSRLMTAAETALVAPPEPSPARTPARSRSRERRLATAIGGFAIVSATTSMAVAAQSALPGDTLYPLKRGIENAQVRVQSGDDDKGVALLENAAGRLVEVGELTRDGDGRATDISDTLDDFSAQSTEASDLLLEDYADTGRVASLEELRAFTADSLTSLERLEGLVPPEARDALVEAAETITAIDQQAVRACPVCTDGPAASSPLLAGAGTLPSAIDDLTADPAAAVQPGAGPDDTDAAAGSGRASRSPGAAPGGDTPSAPPPSSPSLPTDGGSTQPPATGGGADDPLGGVVDDLTPNGGTTGGGTGGGGGGTGDGAGGDTGTTDRNSGAGGLDDLTAGLNDLLGG